MSQENVEIVRSATERVKNREGFARVAHGELDLPLDPEIEWDTQGVGDLVPDIADVYWGHEGVRTFWRRWFEAWRYIEFDLEDLLDAGDEVVVVICKQRVSGRHTGIVTEFPPHALVFTFREGKVVRFRFFPDQEAALKAVGLEE